MRLVSMPRMVTPALPRRPWSPDTDTPGSCASRLSRSLACWRSSFLRPTAEILCAVSASCSLMRLAVTVVVSSTVGLSAKTGRAAVVRQMPARVMRSLDTDLLLYAWHRGWRWLARWGGCSAVLLHQYQFVVLRQLQAVVLAEMADQQLAVAHEQRAGIQYRVRLLVAGLLG